MFFFRGLAQNTAWLVGPGPEQHISVAREGLFFCLRAGICYGVDHINQRDHIN